jgi:hypothetical protein
MIKGQLRKGLLFCGILDALVYVGTDIAAAARYGGYSYVDQMVSELMALGASTRPFLVTFFTLHNLLILAFRAGVRLAAGRKRSPRVST